MKLLKNAPVFKPFTVVCKGTTLSCGAEMEIEFSDLKRIYHEGDPRDQREQSWNEIFVECPECGQHIGVEGLAPYLAAKVPLVR
jgi:Zn finger protein HypA/HybF involved in hydrogenase expression